MPSRSRLCVTETSNSVESLFLMMNSAWRRKAKDHNIVKAALWSTNESPSP